MNDLLKRLSKIGIVPVVTIHNAGLAENLAQALCKGGLPCAEITFRTEAAAEAIKRIIAKYPDMCVGAGTVLTTQQVDAAVEAGAKFIVSPGLNPKIVHYCQEKGVLMIPGTSCPSDLETALELGLDTVKFFPAEQSGGIAKIKAMSAPYGNLKFMPTGGINAENLNSYLSNPKIIACGGSWMVPTSLVDAENWEEIARLTKEAVRTMLGLELRHIGINAENEDQEVKIAERFALLFGSEVKGGNSSIFAGKEIEVMKKPYLGTNGHIAIAVNSVERAVRYLEEHLGFTFDEDTAKYDDKKNIKAIYLNEEIGGFAIHLMQK